MDNQFRVGQNVVCVNASPHSGDPNVEQAKLCGIEFKPWDNFLIEGEVYTIRDITQHSVVKTVGVRLEGIVRSDKDEPYHFSRFRPLQEINLKAITKQQRKIEVLV